MSDHEEIVTIHLGAMFGHHPATVLALEQMRQKATMAESRIAAAESRAREAEAQAGVCMEALKESEWVIADEDESRPLPRCPVCGNTKYEGHATGCIAQTALASNAGRAVSEELRALRKVAAAAKAFVDYANEGGRMTSLVIQIADAVAELEGLKGGVKDATE